jgi:tRNA 2-thiouridine synthesizing protein A
MDDGCCVSSVVLDLAGLKCPLPVLRTRKALQQMAAGDSLQVVCTDPMSAIDIPHLVQQGGDRLVSAERAEGVLTFLIVKGSAR